MKFFCRDEIEKGKLPGRLIQRAVGKEGKSSSLKMSMGFTYWSAKSGPTEPHQHAEETVYVLSARNGWVRFGDDKKRLGKPVPLKAKMILHFPESEWHVFGCRDGGYIDLIFLFGEVDYNKPPQAMALKK